MTADQMDQIRRLYSPSVQTMTSNLPHIGESLRDACLALADDPKVYRLDQLVSQLQTAQTTLQRLRLAMIQRRTEGHGTG